MSVLHRHRRMAATTAKPATPAASTTQSPAASTAAQPSSPDSAPLVVPSADLGRVPGSRTGAAWVGLCATALAAVLLIVFMLQNTGHVDVHFLWLQGSLPLALALFIAAVGVGLLVMIVGTARMTQLRHLFQQRRP